MRKILDYRVLSEREDTKGNKYFILIRRSLLLTVAFELGVKERDVYDADWYLNHISIYLNQNLENPISRKDFEFETFSKQYLKSNCRDLILIFFKKKAIDLNLELKEEEIEVFAERLNNELFEKETSNIDNIILLI